ncbi:hypothetical protein EYF80_020744 [Liparis tanakae]|uniref:Uncharacterized protein n=1 Tax=Liparis tanakae TaxID=230148 RepID=A0A4Z2HU10_9TELE|nr:hypothetical protein EYF80_020744 [Liparis tanakae]
MCYPLHKPIESATLPAGELVDNEQQLLRQNRLQPGGLGDEVNASSHCLGSTAVRARHQLGTRPGSEESSYHEVTQGGGQKASLYFSTGIKQPRCRLPGVATLQLTPPKTSEFRMEL